MIFEPRAETRFSSVIVDSSQMHCFSSDGAGSPPSAFEHSTLVVLLTLKVVYCRMPGNVVSSVPSLPYRRP